MRGIVTITAAFVLFCAPGPSSGGEAAEKAAPAKAPPARAASAKASPGKAAPAITAERFTRVFGRLGLEHEVAKDDEGEVTLYYKKGGYNIGLFPYRDSKGVVDSYQFQAGFESEGPDLEKRVAVWNSTKRFARAVLRDDGVPEVRYDVLVVSCGFDAQLEAEVELFQQLAEEFVRALQPE